MSLVTQATNEVLVEKNEKARVSEYDIGRILWAFLWLGKHNIYDFTNPSASDPANIADFFSSKGLMSPQKANSLKSFFHTMRNINDSASTFPKETNTITKDISWEYLIAKDIFQASMSYWNNFRNNMTISKQGKNFDNPRLLNRNSSGVLQDMIGGITATVLSGGNPIVGSIGAALASIISSKKQPIPAQQTDGHGLKDWKDDQARHT